MLFSGRVHFFFRILKSILLRWVFLGNDVLTQNYLFMTEVYLLRLLSEVVSKKQSMNLKIYLKIIWIQKSLLFDSYFEGLI